MPLYATRYTLPGGREAMTQCYARDPEHLAETVLARRMSERVQPIERAIPAPVMTSEHLRMGHLHEAIHAATWLSMVAVRAGTVDPWELLCDTGPIHELTHLLVAGELFAGPRRNDRLASELEQLERATPGVHPSWGGELRDVAAVEDLVLAESRLRHEEAKREQWRLLQIMLPEDLLAHLRGT